MATTESLLPSDRFGAMWRELGAMGPAHETFERLRAAYEEAHRAYHGARHIAACLRLLDEPSVRALAEHAAEIEGALWFHDAIYDTHAADNEERSAALARDSLRSAGVADDVAARVAAHIEATKSHVATSPDGQLVIDIDLSILGAPRSTFDAFEEKIREEYRWVDTPLYVAGRTAVLRRFAERPFIYGTPLFRARFEATARANISTALERLGREAVL